MIKTKTDYLFYLEADRIAKSKPKKLTFEQRFKEVFFPDLVFEFQKTLRKIEYIRNCKQDPLGKIQLFFVSIKFKRLSYKLGFSIPPNVFGPGLSIAHYGTIIINGASRIGANCRLHACVNIGTEAGYGGKAPIIGDNCYIGPGAKIYGAIKLGNDVAIGANAVINKSFSENNISLGGIPAKIIANSGSNEIIIPATTIINKGMNQDNLHGLPAKEIVKIIGHH